MITVSDAWLTMVGCTADGHVPFMRCCGSGREILQFWQAGYCFQLCLTAPIGISPMGDPWQ